MAFVYELKSTHVWRGDVVVDLDGGDRGFFSPEEIDRLAEDEADLNE